MSTPERILVFRNGSIGNTLAAVPALRCLRESFSNAEIAVVVDPVGEELLANCPYVNRTILYDKHGRDGGVGGFLRVASRVRSFRPDVAVLFKRFFRNGLLSRISGAVQRVGFETDGKAPFLSVTIPYDESIHVAELNLKLVRLMGAIVDVPPTPEIFLTNAELNTARSVLQEHGIHGDYVVAHFGGVSGGAEFVSMECRGELLRKLCRNIPVVLIGTGAQESDQAGSLAESIEHAVSIVNQPLRVTMSVISLAAGFIGTNSGPMHIAAAARVPGIALFRNDQRYTIERTKWRPQFDGLKVVPIKAGESVSESIQRASSCWTIRM
jgi:heptosyltransferase-2